MRSALIISALAGLALAVPVPQDIDLDGVDAAADPIFVAPPYDVATDNGSEGTVVVERSILDKRDGNCATQPAGSGPVASPDTVDAFLSSTTLQVRSPNF